MTLLYQHCLPDFDGTNDGHPLGIGGSHARQALRLCHPEHAVHHSTMVGVLGLQGCAHQHGADDHKTWFGWIFYGNSTGNHGYYQLFRGFSWRFSLKPILGMMVTEVSQWSNVPSCRWYFSLFMVLVPWNNVITTFLLVIPPLPWWLRLWTVRDLATSQNHGALP